MSKLIYLSGETEVECFTIDQLENIRTNALLLSTMGFHPRYADPIERLLNATNDILAQMNHDTGQIGNAKSE